MNTMQSVASISNFLSNEIPSLFLSLYCLTRCNIECFLLWNILAHFHPVCGRHWGDGLEHPSSSSVALCAHTTTHNKSTKHFIRADGYISSEPVLYVLLRCTVVDQVRLKTRIPVLSQRNSLTPYSHRHDDTSRGQWGMTTPHNRRIVWQSSEYKCIQLFSFSLQRSILRSDLSNVMSRSMQMIFTLFPCTVQQVCSAYYKMEISSGGISLKNHEKSH